MAVALVDSIEYADGEDGISVGGKPGHPLAEAHAGLGPLGAFSPVDSGCPGGNLVDETVVQRAGMVAQADISVNQIRPWGTRLGLVLYGVG